MGKLTLVGKITIFKYLAISNIVYIHLLTMISNLVIEELKQIQKMLLLGNKKPKIKHDMVFSKYKNDDLKNVDIVHKEVCLECFWVGRL